MATVIKKISELERLEELTSSSNVIIEENGKAKRFSAASLGKVKTVNGVEPDENGNIEVEAGGSVEQVQPNWNQNDPAQPDYVKNRTHWVEGSKEVLLDANVTMVSCEDPTFRQSEISSVPNLVEGNSYTIAIDGVETSITAQKGELFGADVTYIGDIAIVSMTAPAGGVNFCYLVSDSFPTSMFVLYNNTADTILLKICHDATTYHPLDEGFIPDTIARVSDIPEVNYPVTSVNGMTGDVVIEGGSGGGGVTSWNELEDKPFGEEVSLSELYASEGIAFSQHIGYSDVYVSEQGAVPAIQLVVGNTYFVNWEGTEYQCIAADYSGRATCLGNLSIMRYGDDTGEPFLVMSMPSYDQYAVATKDTAATHSVGIYEGSVTIHTIDPKFLPDELGVGWNDLEDKPFYEETIHDYYLNNQYVNFTGTSGFDGVRAGGLSNSLPDEDIIVGETYTVVVDGAEYQLTAFAATINGNSFTCLGDASIAQEGNTSPSANICLAYNGTMMVVYMVTDETTEGCYLSVYQSSTTAYPIQSKFLPKAAAVPNAAGEAPTAAEFNALLAALREAGYLAT